MNKKTIKTGLICPECGNITTIWRLNNHQRELFHNKKLYCMICKTETNHIELKDIDKYIASLEFKTNLNEKDKKIYQLLKKRSE